MFDNRRFLQSIFVYAYDGTSFSYSNNFGKYLRSKKCSEYNITLKSKFTFAFKMGQKIELADTKILFKITFLSLALKSHAELEPNKPPFLSHDQDRIAF